MSPSEGFAIAVGLLMLAFSGPLARAWPRSGSHRDPSKELITEDRPERLRLWREREAVDVAWHRVSLVFVGAGAVVFGILGLLGVLDF